MSLCEEDKQNQDQSQMNKHNGKIEIDKNKHYNFGPTEPMQGYNLI